MAKIVWLASYPKSGNTWMRTFFWALMNKGPLNLNRIQTGGIFSGKNVVENSLDVNPDLFHAHELEEMQRQAHGQYFSKATETKFIKVHDAYTFSMWDGKPLIPLEPHHKVLHIVRNPLDVVPSFANHSSKDYDSIIEKSLNNPNGGLAQKHSWGNQFGQLMGTWSMHTASWMNQDVAPMKLVRYEDMHASPFETFKSIVQFVGFDVTDEKIQETIDRTRFDKIQQLEAEKGFRENVNLESRFFFHGKTNRWKEVLNEEQIEKIVSVHYKMMKKQGYL